MRKKKAVDAVPEYVTRAFLARLFGVTVKRVGDMCSNGMPQADYGRYDLKICVKFYVDQWRDKTQVKKKGKEITAKDRIDFAKAEKLERENREADGDLIQVDEAINVVAIISGAVIGQFDSIAPRMAGTLAGIDNPAILQKTLYEETRRIKEEISRTIQENIDSFDVRKPAETSPAKNNE